jgi:hypothetical protein
MYNFTPLQLFYSAFRCSVTWTPAGVGVGRVGVGVARLFGFLSGKKPWGRRVAKANRRRNDWSGVRQKTRLGRSWQHSQRFQHAMRYFLLIAQRIREVDECTQEGRPCYCVRLCLVDCGVQRQRRDCVANGRTGND